MLLLRLGLTIDLLASGCRYGYDYLPLITDQAGGSGASGAVAGAAGTAIDMAGGAGKSPNPEGGAGGAPDTGGAEGGQTPAGGAGADHPSLVGYWPFDETAGTIAADASGNGNHGTLQDFVADGWTTGKRGGALVLSDGPYVRVEPSASIDSIAGNDAVSIAAWVMLADKMHGFEAVLSVQLGDTGGELFGLYVNDSRPVVVINAGATHECYGDTLPASQWLHLAGTFDGVSARAYVDGVEVCNVVPDVTDIPTSANPILIGSNQNGPTPGEFLEGTLDELVLYNRALDATELGALALGTLPP